MHPSAPVSASGRKRWAAPPHFAAKLIAFALGAFAALVVIDGTRSSLSALQPSAGVTRSSFPSATKGAVTNKSLIPLLEPEAQERGCSTLSADIPQDAIAFQRLAHHCTDKITAHRYQELYAAALHRYRRQVVTRRPRRAVGHSDETYKLRPTRLLEMGLGCNMIHCVGGGARLLRAFLPPSSTSSVAYHVLEYAMPRCRERYRASGIDETLAAYLESHVCEGSSANHTTLRRCGEAFGPFDVIIDDASHWQQHVMAAFRHWFLSPHLLSGGVYIVEDLQVAFDLSLEYEEHHDRKLLKPELKAFKGFVKSAAVLTHCATLPIMSIAGTMKLGVEPRAVTRGRTFVNALHNALLCKLAAVLCGHASPTYDGGVESILRVTSAVVVGHEAAFLRKR